MTRHTRVSLGIITAAAAAVAFSPAARADTTTLNPVADSYIYGGSPTENYGDAPTLRLRRNAATAAMKVYLQFDVSGIPAGATITGATFSVAPSNNIASADDNWLGNTISVYGLKDGTAGEVWVEGDGGMDNDPAGEITWSNAPGNDTSSGTGFTDDAVLLGTFTPTAGTSGYFDFTSEDLKNFIAADTNGSVTIMLSHTAGSTAFQYLYARTGAKPPKLEVSFVPEPASAA
ncbi:MAG TPA: DNRLRE domain-containing protein, partial [Gemmatimonadaceae bacterium]